MSAKPFSRPGWPGPSLLLQSYLLSLPLLRAILQCSGQDTLPSPTPPPPPGFCASLGTWVIKCEDTRPGCWWPGELSPALHVICCVTVGTSHALPESCLLYLWRGVMHLFLGVSRLNDVNYVKVRRELHTAIQILEFFSSIFFLVSISQEKGNHEFSVEGVTEMVQVSLFLFLWFPPAFIPHVPTSSHGVVCFR